MTTVQDRRPKQSTRRPRSAPLREASYLTEDDIRTPFGRPLRWWNGALAPLLPALIIAAIGPFAGVVSAVQPWMPLVIAAVALAITVALTISERYVEWIKIVLWGDIFLTGVLLFFAAWDRIWMPAGQWTLVVLFAAQTAGSMPAWHLARRAQIRKETKALRYWFGGQTQQIAAPDPDHDPEKERWEAALESIGLPHRAVRFLGRQDLPSGNCVAEFEIRSPAASYESIAGKEKELEIALSRHGAGLGFSLYRGSVTIEPTNSVTRFFVHVDVVDILRNIIMMPDDHAPTTVTKAFAIGRYVDGSPIYMSVLDLHWLIVGATNAGKSNLLHVIIWQLSRCEDCCIWMIDGKGGKTARPWLKAWLDKALHPVIKKLVRPVLDWVGIDRHEGWRILNAAFDISRLRTSMPGTTFKPTKLRPLLIVMVDELSEFVGSHVGPQAWEGKGATSGQFAALFTRLTTLGRGSGVFVIQAVQRNTVDFGGSGNSQHNILGRIAVGADPGKKEDISKIFPGRPGISARAMSALRFVGSLLLDGGKPSDKVLGGRGFFVGDDEEMEARVYKASLLHGRTAGTLRHDAERRAANKWGYSQEGLIDDGAGGRRQGWIATRWSDERAAWLHNDDQIWEGIPDEAPAPPQKPDVNAAVRQAGDLVDRARRGDQAMADARAAAAGGGMFDASFLNKYQAPAAATDPAADVDEDELDRNPPPALEPGDDSRLTIYVAIVRAAGPAGITAKDIKKQLVAAGCYTAEGVSASYRVRRVALDRDLVFQDQNRGRYISTEFRQGRKAA